MLIPRYSATSILQDLGEKMVFLSGPRQVGKTTLAKSFLHKKQDRYFPYLYQVSLRGSEDLLDGRVRIMPAGRFLGAIP